MNTTTRIAALGAAALLAAGMGIGVAGAASAATVPAAGAVFYVMNLDPTHSLVLDSINTGNSASLQYLKGDTITPHGGQSKPIPLAAIDPAQGAGVTLGWRMVDNQGDDDTLVNNFWVDAHGNTATQTQTTDGTVVVPCQVPYMAMGQPVPGQCDNTPVLVIGKTASNEG